MDPSEFGKYDFYNGTSMAAPAVTGAVALLEQANNGIDTLELRDLVVGSVRKADTLDGLVKSGGVLDFSKASEKNPILKKIRFENSSVVLSGNNFGTEKGVVYADGTPVEIVSWSEKSISVVADGLLNKEVSFTVERADGVTCTKTEYINYNATEITSVTDFDHVQGGVTATDGNVLYYLNDKGEFFVMAGTTVSDGTESSSFSQLETLTAMVLDPSTNSSVGETMGTYPVLETQMVYLDGKFYAIANYDTGYYISRALISYDIAENQWVKVTDLDAELQTIKESTLAAYQGKLYVLGGVNVTTGEIGQEVYTVDVTAGSTTFVKAEQSMPARFAALASVVDDKLVVTLGGDGTENVPVNLIFDGTTWTEDQQATFTSNDLRYYYVEDADHLLTYYTAQIGLYENGIIYTGINTNENGNVFVYNMDAKKYEALPCSLYDFTKNADYYIGTTVGDRFQFLSGSEYYDMDEDTWEEYTYSIGNLYSFDVNGGFYQVTGDSTNGIVSGLGYYYPGTKAVITIQPQEGCYIESFKVNGTAVEGMSYTINTMNQDYNVEVVLGSYVTGISFEQAEYTVSEGESITLNPVVGPENANNKALTWSVDKEEYATVDGNGVVTSKSNSANQKVVVTATANDGSQVVASVVVNIVANDHVKAAALALDKTTATVNISECIQLNGVVTPDNAANKKLEWVSNDPSVALVSNTGQVVGLKEGKATITAKTTDGTNLSASCEVTVLKEAAVTPAVTAPAKVSGLKATQTTSTITLKWNKVAGANGYTVYRYDTKTKKNVAIYTTSNVNKVSYKVSKLTAGTAYTYKVAAFKKADNKKVYGTKATLKTATKPKAPSLTSVKRSTSKKVVLKWKKVSGVGGYEVYMSTKKANGYKKVTTVKGVSKVSYTKSGLKKNKTYYFKVRAYKTVNGKKIYSGFSKVKNITMK